MSQRPYWIAFFSSLLIDQLFKALAPEYVLNRNIAFGIPLFSFSAALQIFLLMFFATIIGVKSIASAQKRHLAGLHAVFFGAVASQIIDRVIFGGVRDIWVWPNGLHNNLADVIITFVASLVVCEILRPGCLQPLQQLFSKMKSSWFSPSRQDL